MDAIRSRYETHSLGEYQAQLARVVSRVERILAPLPIQCHVKHRVKAFDEYYAKWKGLEGAEEAGIGDMLGVRIICPFLDDLDEVEQALRRQLPIREVERKGEDHSFREFGYDSIHLQLDLAGETIPHELPGVLPVCEIQLRTILQDAWAEVEHELIYKSDWSIPTDKIKRKLAALNANLSLSDTIFQELRDFQKEVQHKQNRRREIQDTRVRM
ncbi:MAG TPA: hypothetical protein VK997_07835, partial [Deferrisomatales bacterium]|nr:hypothetical protein [Deferrisomatales bacterium]